MASTKNRHKLEEFKKLLGGQEVEIVSPLSYEEPFPEVVEDGETFEENAVKKALAANEYIDMPAFADDSGLMVEALDGAPGINSSRFAGPDATDADRIEKLLKELEGKENRKAKFVCVIAIANRGEVIETFTGEICGTIADAPRGDHGFGYDPVFVPDGFDKTFAELGAEVKDKISHRAKATKAALEFVEDEMSAVDDL